MNLLVVVNANRGKLLRNALGLEAEKWAVVEPGAMLAGLRLGKVVILVNRNELNAEQRVRFDRWIKEDVMMKIASPNPGDVVML